MVRITPKKSFGQHFLHDQSVIAKIIEAASPEDYKFVVEVGPGTGALTRKLPAKGLTLLEADRELILKLETDYPEATVIQTDAAAFDYDLLRFENESWLLIGNLPYNAATAIVMKTLEAKHPPARLVIMVQKEVGERMLALPGHMSVLSVAIGVYATAEKICIVKPGAFVPPPKVDSMVLRLTSKSPLQLPHNWGRVVIALAKAGFASRRKFLVSNLVKAGICEAESARGWLVEHGFTSKARAEELTVEHWKLLAAHLG
jgi:16S rRNA (adenine1518-N6/adenine1519-N6)-dimethyltransferase